MKKWHIILALIFLSIAFGVQIYSNFYLKWIKVAIVYSDPYNEERVQVIVNMAGEDINNYLESINSRYRFKYDIIYLPVTNYHNDTYAYITSNYQFVVGPDYSEQCKSLINFNKLNNTIFISPNSSSDNLYINRAELFRLRCKDSTQGYVDVQFLKYLNITNVILLSSEMQWSKNIIEKFKIECKKSDISIMSEFIYNSTSINFSKDLKHLEEYILLIDNVTLKRTAIVQIGIFETSNLLTQIDKSSVLRNVTWIGSEAIPSLLMKQYFENNTKCFTKMVFYAPLIAPSYSNEFYNIQNKYHKYIDEELDFVQCARYDSCWLYAKAIIIGDEIKINIIKNNIFKIASNYTGLTGDCIFNNDGDRKYGYYNIYKILDDEDYLSLFITYDVKGDSFQLFSR